MHGWRARLRANFNQGTPQVADRKSRDAVSQNDRNALHVEGTLTPCGCNLQVNSTCHKDSLFALIRRTCFQTVCRLNSGISRDNDCLYSRVRDVLL